MYERPSVGRSLRPPVRRSMLVHTRYVVNMVKVTRYDDQLNFYVSVEKGVDRTWSSKYHMYRPTPKLYTSTFIKSGMLKGNSI